jgi:hypothetical protein
MRRLPPHAHRMDCRPARVMIEKFACARGKDESEFLDLDHTNSMILVSLLIPKFARGPGIEGRRTSESGH